MSVVQEKSYITTRICREKMKNVGMLLFRSSSNGLKNWNATKKMALIGSIFVAFVIGDDCLAPPPMLTTSDDEMSEHLFGEDLTEKRLCPLLMTEFSECSGYCDLYDTAAPADATAGSEVETYTDSFHECGIAFLSSLEGCPPAKRRKVSFYQESEISPLSNFSPFEFPVLGKTVSISDSDEHSYKYPEFEQCVDDRFDTKSDCVGKIMESGGYMFSSQDSQSETVGAITDIDVVTDDRGCGCEYSPLATYCVKSGKAAKQLGIYKSRTAKNSFTEINSQGQDEEVCSTDSLRRLENILLETKFCSFGYVANGLFSRWSLDSEGRKEALFFRDEIAKRGKIMAEQVVRIAKNVDSWDSLENTLKSLSTVRVWGERAAFVRVVMFAYLRSIMIAWLLLNTDILPAMHTLFSLNMEGGCGLEGSLKFLLMVILTYAAIATFIKPLVFDGKDISFPEEMWSAISERGIYFVAQKTKIIDNPNAEFLLENGNELSKKVKTKLKEHWVSPLQVVAGSLLSHENENERLKSLLVVKGGSSSEGKRLRNEPRDFSGFKGCFNTFILRDVEKINSFVLQELTGAIATPVLV